MIKKFVEDLIDKDLEKHNLRILLFLISSDKEYIEEKEICEKLLITKRMLTNSLNILKPVENILNPSPTETGYAIKIYNKTYSIFDGKKVKEEDVNLNEEFIKSNENFIKIKNIQKEKEKTISDIFNVWKSVMKRGKRTKFDSSRKKYISSALKNYTKDECIKAISGCSLTPWNMGNNPSNKKFNELSLIFRDSEKIERFIKTHNENFNIKEE